MSFAYLGGSGLELSGYVPAPAACLAKNESSRLSPLQHKGRKMSFGPPHAFTSDLHPPPSFWSTAATNQVCFAQRRGLWKIPKRKTDVQIITPRFRLFQKYQMTATGKPPPVRTRA